MEEASGTCTHAHGLCRHPQFQIGTESEPPKLQISRTPGLGDSCAPVMDLRDLDACLGPTAVIRGHVIRT